MTMRVAVIGGGTTGFMAAAHLSHYFPDYELIQIYDASRPVIAVGEGTIPAHDSWLRQITGYDDDEIVKRFGATEKYGLHFEGWGALNSDFTHWFMPRGEVKAWHLLGSRMIDVLKEQIRGESINAGVANLRSDGLKAKIELDDGRSLEVDLALDARGYPDESLQQEGLFPWIPTNGALISRGPPVAGQQFTRSVARPHGWIAIIPLPQLTVYGYIHNTELSAREEVLADVELFFREQGVKGQPGTAFYNFPNFVDSEVFDGAVYSMGSRAGFIEPLEATALGMTLLELVHLSEIILPDLYFHRSAGPYSPEFLKAYNERFRRGMIELSILIAWYYSRGSRFDSPFWRHASSLFARYSVDPRYSEYFNEFEKWRERAAHFPNPYLEFDAFYSSWKSEPPAQRYGQLFRIHNFAWIGYGIGALSSV